MSHGVNISQKSDKQLADLQAAILKEQSLRRRLDASPEKIEHAIAEYQKATGKGQGEPWVQPTTALDAYRIGAEVEHEGKRWISTHNGNVHPPGTSGWRLKPETDEDGNEIPPPYVPPTGNHDSYQEGERITFDGEIYEAVRDGVVHSPAEYAPDWQLVEGEPEPPEDDEEDDEPVEPGEPDDEDDDDQDDGEPDDEPAEPELDEWQSESHSYTAGDTFTFGGAVYRVRQDHTSQPHWTPDAVPALYERMEDAP